MAWLLLLSMNWHRDSIAETDMIALKKGTKAYFHSVTDHTLLNCVVVAVEQAFRQDGKRVGHVVARITTQNRNRPERYRRVYAVTSESCGTIIPREAYRPGRTPLPYEVEIDK